MDKLKAPFIYFGGKSRVADIVWRFFGDVPNYVEPFAGSIAVLLGRQTKPQKETVSDKDCMIPNLWRAIQKDPEGLIDFIEQPVYEIELHAKHKQYLREKDVFIKKLEEDPDYFDIKLAGWWLWGINNSIGLKWGGPKVYRTIPCMGSNTGVFRKTIDNKLDYLRSLQERLRNVKICYGDWNRIMGRSTTYLNGLTGIFLDPPYISKSGEGRVDVYAEESYTVGVEVEKYCIENGNNPLLRIALCGYEGDYNIPKTWTTVEWKAQGGFGNQRKSSVNENRTKERIYFSPHCLKQ